MKIIDLLNKIANGEEVPKYIKYYDRLHQKEDTMLCCYNNIIYKLDNNIIDLLNEVEIEEKKIPEKLNKLLYREDYATQNACIDDIIRQFNYLIDYLKSKGDE